MKWTSTLNSILIGCTLFIISACGYQKDDNNKVTIAVASNMRYAIEDIAKKFTQKTGIVCELIISSSGKLTAQIKEGAPYHIFISANMKYPYELFENGLTTKNPEIYAYGKLILWTMIDDITPSLQMLENKQIKHIALANPKTAPYGSSTIEILEHYELYDNLKHKLVFGESISQTNQFIVSKSAEIGFTSKSVVLSSQMKNKGNWVDIDKAVYSPITQGVVMIKQKNSVAANTKQFYNFLFSSDARGILEGYGYDVNTNK
ncbi:molybdate ABC transporter substrate-binding protein [Aquimarina sp. AU119]|uniref:molybdate ABC transporter substrate-binding protein n=1 Tax=Aquimarina sp. AU119 TaxID=2108528 RepID=UPI000D69CFC6|nr:molybdate ABC transporter substrate-binding protein [Aquimarina sp. AU119]